VVGVEPGVVAPRLADVGQLLAHYRDLTLDALLRGLPHHGPSYLWDLLPDYPSRPSKGLRPALCLAACAAMGGDVRRALNTAVAVELFHNAFLIHDDIQDASESRRGDPTLHSVYGSAIALNVGNATNLLAMQRLRANRELVGGELAWRLFEETETMLRHSLEGQAIELAWIRENVWGLDESDYYRMCLKKTSWYTFLYPCRAGLLLAGVNSGNVTRLDRYGWYVGAAFQIQDDVLNLAGDYAAYGKEILGDLQEGKRTLMLIELQRILEGGEAKRLQTFLAEPRAARADVEVRWVYDKLVQNDCIAHARTNSAQLAEAAEREARAVLDRVPDGPDKDFLLALPEYVISRDR
jgi:geranylgeranyl diphosphate synthase, type II